MSLETMKQRTEGIRKQASELIEQAYQRGFKAGENSRIDECAKALDEAVIAGRNEAWEAAEKVWSCAHSERRKIFGVDTYSDGAVDIFKDFSASEAIEKIKAYEEKKQEEDEIKVGDEVIYNCGNDKDKATVIDIDVDVLHLLTENGCYISEEFKDVKKTGRHFPEIAEVLKKMQEEE